MSHGMVSDVEITSLHGGTCNLANPWGAGQAVRVRIAGAASKVMHGAVITMKTRAREKLVFTPVAE